MSILQSPKRRILLLLKVTTIKACDLITFHYDFHILQIGMLIKTKNPEIRFSALKLKTDSISLATGFQIFPHFHQANYKMLTNNNLIVSSFTNRYKEYVFGQKHTQLSCLQCCGLDNFFYFFTYIGLPWYCSIPSQSRRRLPLSETAARTSS